MNAESSIQPNDSRYGVLAVGSHGPIEVFVEPHSCHSYLLHGSEGGPGAEVGYCGHREDLIEAGCVSAGTLKRWPKYLQQWRDERGFIVFMLSKAGPNKRGWVQVRYVFESLPLDGWKLPGVKALYPEGLPRIGGPYLRLVVDNTRRGHA